MKNFVRLLLCLSLSVFAVARAISPAKGLSATAKTAQKKETGKKSRRGDDQKRTRGQSARSKKTKEQTILEVGPSGG
jgi:hypothetical protein